MANNKLCECGCGELAPIAPRSVKKYGYLKGEPQRFIRGHENRGRTAELNSHWNGGRIFLKGYVLIKMPDHPRADKRGYVFEHILVLEKVLGRPILPTEATHHRNKIGHDNSPGNLMLFKTNGMHRSFHERLKAYEECGHWDWKKCKFCHQHDDPLAMKISGNHTYHKTCSAEYDRNRYAAKKGGVVTNG